MAAPPEGSPESPGEDQTGDTRRGPASPYYSVAGPSLAKLERLHPAAWEHSAEYLASQIHRYRSGLGALSSGSAKLESRMGYWIVAGGLSLLLAASLLALAALM